MITSKRSLRLDIRIYIHALYLVGSSEVEARLHVVDVLAPPTPFAPTVCQRSERIHEMLGGVKRTVDR